MLFGITSEDVKSRKLVNPGWYRGRVEKIEERPGKKDGAKVAWVFILGLNGDAEGVIFQRAFSEKAPAMAIPYIEAVLGRAIDEDGGSFDLNATIGEELNFYVKNKEWDGAMRNDVADFRAISKNA